MQSSSTLRGVFARVTPVVLVLLTTLVAFEAGVAVSERPGVPEAHLLVQLYYAIGLFVLGGVDLGVPTGGPAWARAALWGAYFLGPAITTTAVVESAIRLTRPAWAQRLWNRDHVVVLGDAAVAPFYVEAVRDVDPGRRVVQIDAADRDLPQTAIDRARRIVVATPDDLTNLGIAWELAERVPDVPIDVHVGQLGLRATAMAPGSQATRVRVFNAYAITADAVYDTVLAPHLRDTPGRDVVAICGFGRFGQTVLRHLHERSPDEVARTLVVDRDATTRGRQFGEQSGIRPAAHGPGGTAGLESIDADLRDPSAWDAVSVRLVDAPVRPIVLVATDDDTTNLQAAVGLRRRLPSARVFVRWASETPFLRAMESEHDLEGLAVADALRAALQEHYLRGS
jgi:voltage-gated potassium channel Kch